MSNRRISKTIQVGDVKVGGNAPITVQSMTKTDTRDVKATVKQIRELEELGCDIIRPAVPDMEAALALREIVKQVKIPVIADIHFHYQLALESILLLGRPRHNPGRPGPAACKKSRRDGRKLV